MRKNRSAIIVLAILATLICADFAYSLLSTCQPADQGAAQQSSYKNNCTAFGGIIPWIAGVALHPLLRFLETYEHPLVAGFTIVLGISTILLWLVTKQAADAARIAAEHIPRVERAYIFGGPAPNGTIFDNPPGTVRVTIGLANYGKTPGILVEIYGEFLEGPPSIPPLEYSFINGQKWEQDVVCGVGREIIVRHQPFMGKKSSNIHFIGYIKYRTVMDDKIHVSYYCVTPKVIDNVTNIWDRAEAVGWDYFD
jgi:hypothetical protein